MAAAAVIIQQAAQKDHRKALQAHERIHNELEKRKAEAVHLKELEETVDKQHLELAGVVKLCRDDHTDLQFKELEELCMVVNTAAGRQADGKVDLGKLENFLLPLLSVNLQGNPSRKLMSILIPPAIQNGYRKAADSLDGCVVPIKKLHESLIRKRDPVAVQPYARMSVLEAEGVRFDNPHDDDEHHGDHMDNTKTIRDEFGGKDGHEDTVDDNARYDGEGFQREHLLQTIIKVTDRHDAFVALPITAIFFIMFNLIVGDHLRILERQETERSLESWINGRNPRTDCENNVDNINSFWEWLLGPEDGIFGALGDPVTVPLNGSNITKYYLSSRNVLVGDLRLRTVTFEGEEQETWLLNSAEGQSYLSSHPGDHLQAARAAAIAAMNGGYSSKDNEYIAFGCITYNEWTRTISLVEVLIKLEATGFIRQRINAGSMFLDSYPESMPMTYAWDGVFIILLLYMLWGEGKEACATLRAGCDEFVDYWKFWNVVDWVSIVLGFAITGIWLWCCMLMQDPVLTELLSDDGKLKVDVMSLTSSNIEELYEHLQMLKYGFNILKVFLAFNTLSIVTKFFKAFGSNPRLTVVTDTFIKAGTDFSHFLIIFFTMYFPFCAIGHILFGEDVENFSSMFASLNTGILMLFGEFGFYLDNSKAMAVNGVLPSGMPVFFLTLWYVVYMFLIFIVLMNLLLAIIIEHYTRATQEMWKRDDRDVPSLYKQCMIYWRFKKQMKGFLPFEEMRIMLEDDDEPAHPDDLGLVTEKSLMHEKAFPEMTPQNAEWLMKYLHREEQLVATYARNIAPAGDGTAAKLKQVLEEQAGRLADVEENTEKYSQFVGAEGIHLVKATLENIKALVDRYNQDNVKITKRVDAVYQAKAKAAARNSSGTIGSAKTKAAGAVTAAVMTGAKIVAPSCVA